MILSVFLPPTSKVLSPMIETPTPERSFNFRHAIKKALTSKAFMETDHCVDVGPRGRMITARSMNQDGLVLE